MKPNEPKWMRHLKKKFLPGEGYLQITDDKSFYYCVMCHRRGEIIAPETEEILCRYCLQCNDEARVRT